MTNIDALRNEWLARDAKLEASLRLNTTLLKDAWLVRHRAQIDKRGFGMPGILASVFVLACVGIFLVHHAGEPSFFIPAAMIQLWTAVMLVLDLRQRDALRRVDYGRPVVEIQRELGTLRVARLATFKWAFLTGQVVWWIPFAIVLFKGVLGVDLYAVSEFMPRFMAYNVLGGLALIPTSVWLAKRHGDRLRKSTTIQELADSISGRDMEAAQAFLGRLSQFEAEEARG